MAHDVKKAEEKIFLFFLFKNILLYFFYKVEKESKQTNSFSAISKQVNIENFPLQSFTQTLILSQSFLAYLMSICLNGFAENV